MIKITIDWTDDEAQDTGDDETGPDRYSNAIYRLNDLLRDYETLQAGPARINPTYAGFTITLIGNPDEVYQFMDEHEMLPEDTTLNEYTSGNIKFTSGYDWA